MWQVMCPGRDGCRRKSCGRQWNIEKAKTETLYGEPDRKPVPPTESTGKGKHTIGNTPKPAVRRKSRAARDCALGRKERPGRMPLQCGWYRGYQNPSRKSSPVGEPSGTDFFVARHGKGTWRMHPRGPDNR